MRRAWTPTLRSSRGSLDPSVLVTARSPEPPRAEVRPPPPPAPRSTFAITAIVAAVVAVAVVSSFVVGARSAAAPREGQHHEDVSPAAELATPGASQVTPAASTVIFARATPVEATLFVDESPMADNPARATMKRDGAAHTIVARAPGYKDKVVPLSFDAPTIHVDISLEADTVEPAPSPPHKASSSPPHLQTVSSVPLAPSVEPVTKKTALDTTDPWQR